MNELTWIKFNDKARTIKLLDNYTFSENDIYEIFKNRINNNIDDIFFIGDIIKFEV